MLVRKYIIERKNIEKMDKIRAHREELKRKFFQFDFSNVPVKKEIIVDLRYIKNKHWPGYGYVQILRFLRS